MNYPAQQVLLKNSQTVTIRSLTEADAEAMIRFMNIVDTESRFLSREPGEFLYTPDEERAIIKARTEGPRSLWLIAEDNGRIIASCSITPQSNRSRFRHRAGFGIVVLREYWGLGIGKAIMSECIGFARQTGYEQVELDVVAGNNRAIALYKSLGLEITGTKKNAMKYPDGTYADEYFMYLPL